MICMLFGLALNSQVGYIYTEQDSVFVGDEFNVKLEFSGFSKEDIVEVQWDTLDKLQFIDYQDTSYFDVDFELQSSDFKGDDYLYSQEELEWTIDDEASPPTFAARFKMTVWEMCVLGIPGPTITLKSGQEIILSPKYLLVKDPLLAELQDFAPSKGIFKEVVTLWDYVVDYWWMVSLWLAILLSLLYLRHWRKKKEKLAQEEQVIEEVEPEPIIPAHIIALEKLGDLKSNKSWESENDKMFVSDLTDIIREYIENRFGVLALEMTTSEITEALGKDLLNNEQLGQLGNALNVSDMIKFAKAKADSNLYEQFVDEAIDLVKDTKENKVETTEE